MKHLQEFINEQIEDSCKSITFDFTGLEDAEDTLKSFEDKENCKVKDNKLTVSVCDKLDSVQDKLQRSSKVTNDESYAQKVKKFNSKVEELNNAIEEMNSDDDSSSSESE